MSSVILGFFKAIPIFLQTWRLYIVGGAIITAGLLVFNYIDNHGEMKAKIISQNNLLEQCDINAVSQSTEIMDLNARIEHLNARELEELHTLRVRLQAAEDAAEALRVRSNELREELAMTRFETLEAIQDDEDFADWVSEPVPSAGWRLLQQAVDSGSN